MDPVIVGAGSVALGALGYVSQETVTRLLGPTADYLGEGLKDLTQKRLKNIGKIFSSAANKVGDHVVEGEAVSPRVLQAILNEGSYCEDPLFVEYFGGVLASSRTGQTRDDRGVSLARSMEGMSSYQLRAHFVIYRAIQQTFRGEQLRFDIPGRPKMTLFIPYTEFQFAMDYSRDESAQSAELSMHALFGLKSRDLVENFHIGLQAHLAGHYTRQPEGFFDSDGIVVIPSRMGAELYMWAAGFGRKLTDWMLSSDCPIFSIEGADVRLQSSKRLHPKV